MNRRNRLYGLATPNNGRNPLLWDLFWMSVLAKYRLFPNNINGSFCRLRFANRDDLYAYDADILQYFGLNRVLFGGNGLSGLPYFYQYRGFRTTVLDISRVATRASRCILPDDGDWLHFFGRRSLVPMTPEEREEMQKTAAEALSKEKIPGGTMEFVSADLYDWDCGTGSFDAVILKKFVDCYRQKRDRQELARHVYRWLKPGGIVIIESCNQTLYYPSTHPTFGVEEDFEEAGFRLHLKDFATWGLRHRQCMDSTENERLLNLGEYQQEAHHRQIRNAKDDFDAVQEGQRLAIFHYGTSAADPVPITPQDCAYETL